MNPGLFTVMLVLLCAGSLGVQSRQVILPGSPSPPFNIVAANNKIVDERNKPNLLEERKDSKQYDEAALFDGLQVAGSFGDRNSVGSVEVEERTGFTDLAKHLGTFVFRGVVRRAIVKPMVKGFKRLIPNTMYSYYNDVLASKRVFKMMSPLSPAISSYAYNKFEQGVFWSIKRSWKFAVDNFVEFEDVELGK